MIKLFQVNDYNGNVFSVDVVRKDGTSFKDYGLGLDAAFSKGLVHLATMGVGIKLAALPPNPPIKMLVIDYQHTLIGSMYYISVVQPNGVAHTEYVRDFDAAIVKAHTVIVAIVAAAPAAASSQAVPSAPAAAVDAKAKALHRAMRATGAP